MLDGIDPPEFDGTDCPSRPDQASFTCTGCKGSFPKPLLAKISSGGQTQTYYACPRCMIKVHDIKPVKKEARVTSTLNPAKDAPELDTDAKCQHFFGYLSKRQRETPFPEECLTCPKMVECLSH